MHVSLVFQSFLVSLTFGIVAAGSSSSSSSSYNKGKGKQKMKVMMNKKGRGPSMVAYRLASEQVFATTADGDSLSYSVYEAHTDKAIGYYFDSSTFITHGGGSLVSNATFECIYSGSYNFDFGEAILPDAYGSQIFVAGVCNSGARQQAIVGGTNAYLGIKGGVNIVDDAKTDENGEPIGDILEFMIY